MCLRSKHWPTPLWPKLHLQSILLTAAHTGAQPADEQNDTKHSRRSFSRENERLLSVYAAKGERGISRFALQGLELGFDGLIGAERLANFLQGFVVRPQG